MSVLATTIWTFLCFFIRFKVFKKMYLLLHFSSNHNIGQKRKQLFNHNTINMNKFKRLQELQLIIEHNQILNIMHHHRNLVLHLPAYKSLELFNHLHMMLFMLLVLDLPALSQLIMKMLVHKHSLTQQTSHNVLLFHHNFWHQFQPHDQRANLSNRINSPNNN